MTATATDHPTRRIVTLIVDGRHASTGRSSRPLAEIAREALRRRESAQSVVARYQSTGESAGATRSKAAAS